MMFYIYTNIPPLKGNALQFTPRIGFAQRIHLYTMELEMSTE